MLFNAQTSDANGSAVVVESDGRQGINPRLLAVWGTFDSGVFTLQHSFDGGTTWINGEGISIASALVTTVYVKTGSKVRGVLTGGGGSMSVSADLL